MEIDRGLEMLRYLTESLASSCATSVGYEMQEISADIAHSNPSYDNPYLLSNIDEPILLAVFIHVCKFLCLYYGFIIL